MKQVLTVLCVLTVGTVVFAQETMEESTSATTATTTTYSPQNGELDLKGPFLFDDATAVKTNTFDFRLNFAYDTASGRIPDYRSQPTFGGQRRSRGRDDGFAITPSIHWGPLENLEVFLAVPMNVGDGKQDKWGFDGNYDSQLGVHYQFIREADWYPSVALRATGRFPTGYRSNGVDGELKGLMTKTIIPRLRAHANAFISTVNGNNNPNARHFQWGFTLGMDYELCKDCLYAVVDYAHRSSYSYGVSNINLAEVGLEWFVFENNRLGLSTQFGLDDNEETPNWGMMVKWVFEVPY
jgi:hypothetical protein